jgi:thioredoxin 1
MKELVFLTILLAVILFAAGCTEDNQGNSTSSGKSLENAVVKVSQLKQINTSLEKGPVFMKMGSKWCPHCRAMKPILEELATEYKGNVTIASVDVDQNPELAEYFRVQAIPDSFVIVDIENGSYVYMQENGNVSTDRSTARIIGLNEDSKNATKRFEEILNLSLLQQGEDKSQ